MKYTVTTAPPTAQPIGTGTPATRFRMVARPMSCDARMKVVPIYNSSEMTLRTEAL
jgi:hypothetical protein